MWQHSFSLNGLKDIKDIKQLGDLILPKIKYVKKKMIIFEKQHM